MATMTRRDRRLLRELERKGLVRIGTMKLPKGFFDAPRPKPVGPEVSKTLIEERRQAR
jgi:hypothetical protein